jgi:hypothetical protein
LYTGGKRIKSKDTKDVNATFKSLFDKYAVDIYLCGHEHHLEYIKPVGPTHYFISGAGSEVRPVSKFPTYGIFAAAQAGFMTFSITQNSFVTNTINDKGKIIYTTTVKK